MREKTKVYDAMDLHKDSVVIAVLREGGRDHALVQRLSHEPRRRRRGLDRLARKDVALLATGRAVPATCRSG